MDSRPRWQYRFDNYKRAFILLREAIELKHNRETSVLEQEGIIQQRTALENMNSGYKQTRIGFTSWIRVG